VDSVGNVSSTYDAAIVLAGLPESPTDLAYTKVGSVVTLTWEYDSDLEGTIDGFVVCGNRGIETEWPDTTVPLDWDGRLGLATARVGITERRLELGSILSFPGLWRVCVFAYKDAAIDENYDYLEFRVYGGTIHTEPDPPRLVKAEPVAGGDVELTVLVVPSADNVTLNLYSDAGTGTIDYTSILGTQTITASDRSFVEYTVTFDAADLTEGIENKCAVRVLSSSGYEEMNTDYLTATPDATNPDNPTLTLTGEA
jgi:hypothetical protein